MEICDGSLAGSRDLNVMIIIIVVVVVVVVVLVIIIIIIIIIIMMMMMIAFKGALRDFLYNLLIAPRTITNTYAQVAKAQSSANHVQHIERLSRATCRVPLGTKGQLSFFSLTELKSHLV